MLHGAVGQSDDLAYNPLLCVCVYMWACVYMHVEPGVICSV